MHLHLYIYTSPHIHTGVGKYMYKTTRDVSPGNLKQADGLNPQTRPREGQGRTATQTSGTGYQRGHMGAPQHRFSF